MVTGVTALEQVRFKFERYMGVTGEAVVTVTSKQKGIDCFCCFLPASWLSNQSLSFRVTSASAFQIHGTVKLFDEVGRVQEWTPYLSIEDDPLCLGCFSCLDTDVSMTLTEQRLRHTIQSIYLTVNGMKHQLWPLTD